jgi:hypothetical protein
VPNAETSCLRSSGQLAASNSPRAEFRVFGHDVIETVKARLWNGRTVLGQVRRMPAETYFLSAQTDDANVKVRDNLIDIKIKVARTPDGYEVFQPTAKFSLPISRVDLSTTVQHLKVVMNIDQDCYGLEDILMIARTHTDIRLVTVEKLRYGFTIDGVICEFAQVWFNGALIETACVESEQHDAMRPVIAGLGLSDRSNVNYLQVAKKIVGLG